MNKQAMVKVWDPLVRSFHWLLVIAFLVAYLSEDDFLLLHTYAGYTVFGLILFRLFWGLIGPHYARFGSFVTRPRVAWQYLKDTVLLRAKRYLGHNPAGAAMIVLLLVSLLLTTVTGMAAYGAVESAGPLADWFSGIGERGEDFIKETHEFFANFSVFLVVLHVGGVIVESLLHRENLVRSMINGYKQADQQTTSK
jgi:cytochrome b